jgi:hypothetical protein
MANKASFSAEEWSRVVASPMVTSTAITAAEPSGLWGLLQEGMAGGWALLKAKQDIATNALVKARRQRLPRSPLHFNLAHQEERRREAPSFFGSKLPRVIFCQC